MSLPSIANLETMNYSFRGQPFVSVPAKSAVDIKTMDYFYQAQPFVGNYDSAGASNVKTVMGVSWSSVKTWNGVNTTAIKILNGVTI